MSKKSAKIAALIARCQGQELDAHYLGFFECFNEKLFYEAHDVLEELWLEDRRGANGNFYKGLIQLAGAFVHLQKNRLQPAGALFKLARTNLTQYRGIHQQLDILQVTELIDRWLKRLEDSQFAVNPFSDSGAPKLSLRKNDD